MTAALRFDSHLCPPAQLAIYRILLCIVCVCVCRRDIHSQKVVINLSWQVCQHASSPIMHTDLTLSQPLLEPRTPDTCPPPSPPPLQQLPDTHHLLPAQMHALMNLDRKQHTNMCAKCYFKCMYGDLWFCLLLPLGNKRQPFWAPNTAKYT